MNTNSNLYNIVNKGNFKIKNVVSIIVIHVWIMFSSKFSIHHKQKSIESVKIVFKNSPV